MRANWHAEKLNHIFSFRRKSGPLLIDSDSILCHHFVMAVCRRPAHSM